MNSESFKSKVSFHDVPEMCQPLYNIIMFNKVFFLKDTIDKKYFNNDMVIWADAGGLREDVQNYRGHQWPNIEKIKSLDNSKITFFSHNSDFDIRVEDRQFYSLSQIRNIQGIFDITYTKNKNFFNLIKCSWREYFDILK